MSDPGQAAPSGERTKGAKSADAFRTISEVSEELGVPQHVLRFWESKFTQVNPMKRGGGRRYYRPDDIRILERIRILLYVDGFTIKGVQRLLREHGLRAVLDGRPAAAAGPSEGPAALAATRPSTETELDASSSPQSAAPVAQRRVVQAAVAELLEIRKLLSPAAG